MYNQMPNQPQYRMNNSGITWVQGIEGAKAYQLFPNSNALLMDSETNDTFYIKTSDNIGMCNLRKFKYSEVMDEPKQNADMSQYVTRSELEELINSMLGGKSNE